MILFEKKTEAEEMAFILKGRWNNHNAIELKTFDLIAFDLALNFCQIPKWCFQKDSTSKIKPLKPSIIRAKSVVNYSDILGVQKMVFEE